MIESCVCPLLTFISTDTDPRVQGSQESLSTASNYIVFPVFQVQTVK